MWLSICAEDMQRAYDSALEIYYNWRHNFLGQDENGDYQTQEHLDFWIQFYPKHIGERDFFNKEMRFDDKMYFLIEPMMDDILYRGEFYINLLEVDLSYTVYRIIKQWLFIQDSGYSGDIVPRTFDDGDYRIIITEDEASELDAKFFIEPLAEGTRKNRIAGKPDWLKLGF